MSNIDTFYSLLNESTISLLGYTFKEESLKDELISKIPHYKVSEIDSSFNLKSSIREFKINSVLSDVDIDIKYFVIDLQELRYSIIKHRVGVASLTSNNKLGELSLASELRGLIDEVSFQFRESEYKLLLTSPLNREILYNGDETLNFMGGSKPIYTADLAFRIAGDKIKILKNRYSDNNDISINGLKEYNYEYSK